jgi:lysophospholipid acyltransferase (LPLAT)-like uncharacterized protein
MMKKIFRFFKKRFPGFLPSVICLLLKGLYSTLRVRMINAEIPRSFHSSDTGIIQVMWHARLGLGPFAYQGKGAHILISSHGDGEIIARITGKFGFEHVRGSSRRGGKRALKALLDLARGNRDLIITPDGPKGPAMQVKPGTAQVAMLTGMAVVPFAMSASPSIRLNSWDRFLVPLPFSRCFFVWGEPISRVGDEDVDSFRARIGEGLDRVTAWADELAAK